MSSILKALKRLETEFPKEKESPAWSQNIDTKGAIQRKTKSFFLSNKWMGLLAGALLLCIGGWFIFDHYTNPSRKGLPSDNPGSVNVNRSTPPLEYATQKKFDNAKSDQNKNRAKRNKSIRSNTNRSEALKRNPTDSKKYEIESPPLPMTSGDNSALKLQAISWSQDPKKCIAVINGVILRVGETVDGYSVTRIGQDDVIVTKEGKDHRLMFNLK